MASGERIKVSGGDRGRGRGRLTAERRTREDGAKDGLEARSRLGYIVSVRPACAT